MKCKKTEHGYIIVFDSKKEATQVIEHIARELSREKNEGKNLFGESLNLCDLNNVPGFRH